jgi:hypothetical protein
MVRKKPVALELPMVMRLSGNSIQIAKITSLTDSLLRVSMIDIQAQTMVGILPWKNLLGVDRRTRHSSASAEDLRNVTIPERRRSAGVRTMREPSAEIEFELDSVIRRLLSDFEIAKRQSVILQDGSIVVSKGNEVHRIKMDYGIVDLLQRCQEEITCLAADGDFLVTANREAFLTVLKSPDYSVPIHTISAFTSVISCCSISCSFHALIFGTNDGFLSFCSLTNGSLVRLVNLESRRPKMLLITPSWGFVIAYTTGLAKGKYEYGLSLFTINGDLIRSCHLKHRLTAWSARKSDDGFDMVVLADANGDCYFFEAFFLNPKDRFLRAEAKVLAIALLDRESTAVMAMDNGKVLFAPVHVQ